MNIEARQIDRSAKTKLQIIDCDIHPKSSLEDLRPYLSNRWWDYAETYGARSHHGYVKGFPYPKGQPLASRRDAWPPDGGLPASNYEFMREQHLDLYGIEYGVMNPLSPSGQGEQNDEFSAALAFAANEFQINHWNALDARLKASLIVPYEDPDASRKEIRRRTGDRRFAHVLMLTRTADLMGRRRYWPIYEAACEAGLPVGVHVFGYSGRAVSNTGWPSFYIEEMTEHASACQAQVTSLIMEGVIEHFPQLKFVFIEGGFGWMPSLGYRLDRGWQRDKRPCRTSSGRLPNICASISGSPPSRWRSRRSRSTSPRSWKRSATTASCSRRIIRTGISTIRSSPCRRTSAKSAAGRSIRATRGRFTASTDLVASPFEARSARTSGVTGTRREPTYSAATCGYSPGLGLFLSRPAGVRAGGGVSRGRWLAGFRSEEWRFPRAQKPWMRASFPKRWPTAIRKSPTPSGWNSAASATTSS